MPSKDTERVSSQSVNGVSAAPDSPAAFLGGSKVDRKFSERPKLALSRHRQAPAGTRSLFKQCMLQCVCVSGFIQSRFQTEH